ncbi:hypothetical protein AB4Z09_18205 [Rhodococcus sp. TAF43]
MDALQVHEIELAADGAAGEFGHSDRGADGDPAVELLFVADPELIPQDVG